MANAENELDEDYNTLTIIDTSNQFLESELQEPELLDGFTIGSKSVQSVK